MTRSILLAHLSCWVLVGCGASERELRAPADSRAPRRPATETAEDFSPDNRGVAVVELFTSQGCSSCPAADGVLERLATKAQADGLSLYCLSFHVDYWNDLGWIDPYSEAAFTARQEEYAAALDGGRMYTPQTIVNGVRQFVGSREAEVSRAVGEALRMEPIALVAVSARASTGGVEVSFRVSGTTDGADLCLAVVQTTAEDDVPAGENGGRHLSHVNVVRAFHRIELLESNEGSAILPLPAGIAVGDVKLIAFVQRRDDRRIVGAMQAPIAGP